jgi:mannan endo-1,4-beta-mannosidase
MRLALAGVLASFALAVFTGGCAAETSEGEASATSEVRGARTSDPLATPETQTVFDNLQLFDSAAAPTQSRKILVGQQEADTSSTTTSGLTMSSSTFEKLVGKAPAVIGYELSLVDRGATTTFDREAFRRGAPGLRELVRDKHEKGILVSLVWHMRCPKSSPNLADKFGPGDCPADYTLEELLSKKRDGSQGKHFTEWRGMLDELAELLWSFKDDDGKLIPVQIRPFHEFTGDWFWWGRSNRPEIYKAAWREMVDYLRRGRGLHAALWVFCPDKPTDRYQLSRGGDFERFYPGDDVVDVVGFDRYDWADGSFAAGYAADIRKIGAFARAHKKVAAVAEVGLNLKRHGLSANPTWFTGAMMAPLVSTQEGRSFSYVALWRNAPWEKFTPEPGDGAIADDFVRMAEDGASVLSEDAGNLYTPLAPGSS